MWIEKSEVPGIHYCDQMTCSEYNSPAEYLIRFNGCLIPMCQDSIDDLYREIYEHVSPDVKSELIKGQ